MLVRKAAISSIARLLATIALTVSPVSPLLAADGAAEVTFIGPIESVNCLANTVDVLGTRFYALSPNILRSLCDLHATGNTLFVLVAASADSNGSLKLSKLASINGEMYVPGVSSVLVSGTVTSSNPNTGEFEVLGSRFAGVIEDLPALGEFVEVVGTQPQLRGVVIASSLWRANTKGIVGSGTSGIVGSGAQTNGIVGSGAATNGIVGSGVQTSGIVGSGAATAGIVGSGSEINQIVGSGSETSGIVGSGVATKGIVGSGAAISGIVGSGATTSGIVGPGPSTSGIVGSGT